MSANVAELSLSEDQAACSSGNGMGLPLIQVDERGSRCPIPVLAVKRALRTAQPGQPVELLATDPDAAKDIPQYVQMAKLKLLASSLEEGVYRFVLCKPEA